MRRYLWLGVLLLAGPACEPAPVPADTDVSAQTAEDVLAEVRVAWVAAYNVGDAATLATYFADDAVLLPPGEPAVSGRAAVDAYLRQMLDGWTGTLEILSHEVRTSGDLAVDQAMYSVQGEAGAAPRTGKYLMVWQRDNEGAWKIVSDMWNSDR